MDQAVGGLASESAGPEPPRSRVMREADLAAVSCSPPWFRRRVMAATPVPGRVNLATGAEISKVMV
jgi:hypothetical protein